MSNITLVVIFNHKFDKNIPILKQIYTSRFSSILFLVPFYAGNDPSIIPVYESSHQFQGYIAQAYMKIKECASSHYVFIGDDLILNPSINENNILRCLSVNKDDAYIESITCLKETDYWCYFRFDDVNKAFHTNSVNYSNEIPSIEFARQKAHEFGFDDYKIHKKVKYKKYGWMHVRSNLNDFFNRIVNPIDIKYPLVTGYSDFFILPSEKLSEFARLSGIFAAMRLFVEVSIPTTFMLLMDTQHLKTQKNTNMLTPKLWWITETATNFEKNCDFSIEKMMENWPENYAYLHPIKLSKWH